MRLLGVAVDGPEEDVVEEESSQARVVEVVQLCSQGGSLARGKSSSFNPPAMTSMSI